MKRTLTWTGTILGALLGFALAFFLSWSVAGPAVIVCGFLGRLLAENAASHFLNDPY